MSPLPRLLTIMGSGETAPTMAKVHRALLERLGPPPAKAVVLDTPFGFQENADDIVARAQAYFAESVGAEIGVASLRSAARADRLEQAAFVAAVTEARYVFAGPGSPSYALRQWRGGPLPTLLAEKLRRGGGVTFSSAAALTLGIATIPVYEIYKAGEPPAWLEGLDLIAEAGLRAAVIPHYNNAEGGNHDTRYCYLGERRLTAMEAELPQDAFVLGVDEHSGLLLDLGEDVAQVVGVGGVTVRARGQSVHLPSGTTLPISEIAAIATALLEGRGTPAAAGGDSLPPELVAPQPPPAPAVSPLLTSVHERQSAFTAALAAKDVDGAIRAILGLDDDLVAWSRDTLESGEADQARSTLHAMILSLGRAAVAGTRDPADVVGPFIEVLLDQRARARASRRFEEADALRDHLLALGVEVRDTPAGSEWLFTDRQGGSGP